MIRSLGLAALLGGAFVVVAGLSSPVLTAAFSVTGEFLDLEQRDMRVVNSFVDPSANDNVVPQAVFPGTLGAPLAIRKAHAEWSSGPWAGTGEGDPLASNPVLGDGAANFDNTWQGVTGEGGTNDNIHVALPGSGGSTLAFTEFPTGDGWRIIYYETWTWSDGPGAPAANQIDIQAIATHEIGHVIGLGHTSVPGQTMSAVVMGDGLSARSIEFDDIAGVQFVYGAKTASKPLITSVEGTHATGSEITIRGQNFAATGNEVWFTHAEATGEPIKVLGVASQAGGQTIALAVPGGAAAGELLVRTSPADMGSVLSNAFPYDVTAGVTEIHPGFSSVGGEPPVLTATGDVAPGGEFAVQLLGGLPSASGLVFVAPAEAALPFKGGTLYAAPVLLTVPIATDGAGELAIDATMPATALPGTVIVIQAAFAITGGPAGVQLSNGLRIDVP